MKKNSKKLVISTLLLGIINLFFFFILANNKISISLATYMSTLQLIISLYVLYLNKGKIISISTIFLVLSNLFYFGQAYILAYGFEDIYYHRSVLAMTSMESFINAMYFTMISHFFIVIGMLWNNDKKAPVVGKFDTEEQMLNKLKVIAMVILLISFLPLMYLDVLKLEAVRTGGYLSTYETYSSGINKYLRLIGLFARPAMSVLIISYKKQRKRATLIFVLSTIYYVIMMTSGDRGENIIYLLANVFIYIKIIRNIKFRDMLLLTILAYFFLGFISTISIIRDTSDITLESFIYYYNHRSTDGILYSILREFGSTITTLIYSMNFTEASKEYNYGLTYIFSWLNLSPKLPGNTTEFLTKHFTFVRSFPQSYQVSIGGSYLGELFYNFGWFGSIIAFFVGNFIGKVDSYAEKSIESNSWVIFSIIMVLFPNLLLWIRGYFVELIFVPIWLSIFIVISYSESTNRKRNLNHKMNI